VKTHGLADALRKLATILKEGPSVELEELKIEGPDASRRTSGDIAVNLATLAAMSRVEKREWIDFIEEYGIPIHYRPRDASRDVLGKLLRYLERHPEAIRALKYKASTRHASQSSALTKALSILLGGDSDDKSQS